MLKRCDPLGAQVKRSVLSNHPLLIHPLGDDSRLPCYRAVVGHWGEGESALMGWNLLDQPLLLLVYPRGKTPLEHLDISPDGAGDPRGAAMSAPEKIQRAEGLFTARSCVWEGASRGEGQEEKTILRVRAAVLDVLAPDVFLPHRRLC